MLLTPLFSPASYNATAITMTIENAQPYRASLYKALLQDTVNAKIKITAPMQRADTEIRMSQLVANEYAVI
jgi:hypothetical protein